MKIEINKEKIYQNVGLDFENESDYINFLKDMADLLARNNKNYNKIQYYAILDMKEILENIEIKEEV